MEIAMVTDGQVSELRRLLALGKSLAAAARMASMDKKTARSYRDDDRLPSQRKTLRNYRTRVDPFADIWDEVEQLLQSEPRLKAKTLFDDLQRRHPGKIEDSTRRTFERRVASWRAIHGPAKPVYFPQDHHPGNFAASDFTVCNSLGVTIARATFKHTLFHCVLTYSNFESVSLCFSESFEALSEGIQNAFWQFGGVPIQHRTDSLSAAVRNHSDRTTLTTRYAALMAHYGCTPQKTNARCANENGDVESQNGHLKDRIDQALLLRGSRDFSTREAYMEFVQEVVGRANANRSKRFAEEQQALRPLPDARLDTDDILKGIRVSKSSTINVRANTYSVPSRLIGTRVDVRITAETITVTRGGTVIQTMRRLVGKQAASINYRHVIDSLVRKPGAFADYRYREEMFPSSHFRFAYDDLKSGHRDTVADKMYLQILKLAADESQQAVEDALRHYLSTGQAIMLEDLRERVSSAESITLVKDIEVEPPNLSDFDSLLPTFCKDATDDPISANDRLSENAPPQHEVAQSVAQSRPEREPDATVQRTSHADVSGPVSADGDTCRSGADESPGLSIGTDDARMPGPTRRANQTIDDPVTSSSWQDLGIVRPDSIADACSTATGDASRRNVFGSAGEHPAVRQTGIGEESCVVRARRAVGAFGAQHIVHDLLLAGATTVDRQTGLAAAEADQAVLVVRGPDHRRPGVCSAESRGDGSVIHAACRTLRTGQRFADKQFSILEVGSDLQGCDDDGRCDRSLGAPQCDHRTERAELPRGKGQEQRQIHSRRGTPKQLIAVNSNCR